MANPTTSSKDFGHSTTEKMKDAAAKGGEKVKEVAGQAADKAREVASGIGDKLSSAASSVGKTADQMTSAAGSGAQHLADTIRSKGPREGVLGSATRVVAGGLQEGGKYLEEEGFSGMMEDVTELVRRNPLPAVLVGVGIGFLIARTLGSS